MRWLDRHSYEDWMNDMATDDTNPPIWPFPPNGKPTPPTPQQAAQDKREELERLGDALM